MGTKVFDNALDLITFTRASGGTALRKISYGSELVTNGTFDSNTVGWIPTANATIALDGDDAAVTTSAGSNGVRQTLTGLTIGAVYQLSGTLRRGSNATNADLRILTVAGALVQNLRVTSTSDTDVSGLFVATGTSHLIGLQFDASVFPATAYYDNISVKEVLFDRPDGTLTLFNHPTNVPRIEYDASGAVKGLLVEEARTNLLTYSGDFTNAVWSTKVNEVTGITDPAGGSTAITVSASSDNQIVLRHANLSIASTAAVHTNSLYVKRRSGTGTLRLSDPSNVAVDVTSQLVLGEWVKVSASNVVYLGTTVYFILTAGTAGDEFDVAFGQTEAGAFPTSYIPTAGATATRAADIASIPVSAFGYNQTAGTFVADYTPVAKRNQYALSVATPSGASDYLALLWGNVGDEVRFQVTSGGATSAQLNTQLGTVAGTRTIHAGAYKINDFAACNNGGSVLTDMIGDVPSGLTIVWIGEEFGGYLNGHIRSITYYPRRLSNAQLIEVTS